MTCKACGSDKVRTVIHTNTPRCLCFAKSLAPFRYEMQECSDCGGATLSQPALMLLTERLETVCESCDNCCGGD